MSQTFINASGQPIGVAGQLIDNGEVVDVLSAFSEETVNQIPFGCGVVFGTADDGAKLPSTSVDKPKGVNLFGLNHMPAGAVDAAGNQTGDLGATGLLPKAGLQVLRKGRALLPIAVGTTVVPGDRLFLLFRSDGGSNTQPGVWSNAQDGGSNYIDCTRMAQVMSSMSTVFTATGGSLNVAICDVDFVNRNS